MSGKQEPLAGVCQVTGLFHDSCLEGDGVENRILVAVHKISDVWVSPGLERTLWRERERAQLCAFCRDRDHFFGFSRGPDTQLSQQQAGGGELGT